ncbi:hypothetical protein [Kitasatospora cineracea]|uniref:hypothetical protein n=1 Tax=Kitasatospora cineracea TaxID=88074 RepID=UPI00381050D3
MSTTEFEDPHLLADFLALETPEGYRAELVAGEIVLSPPQDGGHEAVIGRVLRQVFRADREFDYGGNKRPGYARAGIPLYLVIDRRERAAVLYGRGPCTATTPRPPRPVPGFRCRCPRRSGSHSTPPTCSGSRSGWRDAPPVPRRVCNTAEVSSLSLIISSRRAGPQ